MTKEEAEAQLVQVNSAIEQLLANKRLSRLEIGSGTDKHVYEMNEISMAALKELRNELLAFLDSLTPATANFRLNTHIPMVVGKDIF